MKITVIFTGGTIGSSIGADGYIAPGAKQPYRLLEKYRENCRADGMDEVEFFVEEPYRILSENMNAGYVNRLADCVRKVMARNDSEGIIITHGTDTLQYTAALLSYVFETDCVPVLLVSSDFPLEDARANGMANFMRAVEFIKCREGRGVFVSYRNDRNEEADIYRGTRLLMHQPYSARLYPLDGVSFHGKVCYNREASMDRMERPDGQELRLTEDAGNILWIRPCVGMTYPQAGPQVRAVLHDSYHSGTIAVNAGLEEFAGRMEQAGIPVYLTGASSGEAEYETVRMYEQYGIRVLPKMSLIAAYCKLWLALSNDLDVNSIMNTCIAEDIIQEQRGVIRTDEQSRRD